MQVKKLIRLLFCLSFVLLTHIQSSSAQQSGNYDEDEYDGEYEYSEQDKYNPQNDFYNRSERNLKRSYEEDELYNGGYRRKPGSSENSSIGVGGSVNLGGFSRKRSNNAADDELPVNSPKFNRHDGLENGVGTNGNSHTDEHTFSELQEGYEPGKGQENPDTSDPKTPPPPPDEPDVPIDSAVPLLVIVGLALASYKFSGAKLA